MTVHSNHHQELVRRIRDLSRPLEPLPTEYAEKMSHLENIQAVLFDVYGTLFVSGSGDISLAALRNDAAVLSEALAAAGFEGRLGEAAERGAQVFLKSIGDAHAKRRGEGVAHPEVQIRAIWQSVLQVLEGDGLLTEPITFENVARLAVEYECRVNPVWPMPGAADILSSLHQRRKRLGTVSNAQFYTPLLFEVFFDKTLPELGFDLTLCAWSYQAREAKPSVGLFQEPLARLQREHSIAPENVLYVGNDMLNDILPASQLGCKTCLFAGDARSLRLREDDERCGSLAPDLIINDLSALVEAIT